MRKFWQDNRGQDLIEYVLIFLCLALVAGAFPGTVTDLVLKKLGTNTFSQHKKMEFEMLHFLCASLSILVLWVIVYRRYNTEKNDKNK